MKTQSIPVKTKEPLLFHLSLTGPEIKALHDALTAYNEMNKLVNGPTVTQAFLVARSIEADLKIQLRTDHTGLQRWLAGLPMEISRPVGKEVR